MFIENTLESVPSLIGQAQSYGTKYRVGYGKGYLPGCASQLRNK
jgi:hypothetical protein